MDGPTYRKQTKLQKCAQEYAVSANQQTVILNHRFLQSIATTAPTLFDDYPLVRDTLKPSTRTKYLSAFNRFAESTPEIPTDPYELDLLLRDYIHDQAMDNPSAGRKQDMLNLLSHLTLVAPELSRMLPRSRRALKGWSKLTPSKSALPLTRHVMLAIVHYLRCIREPVVAAALATAWGGYLRASEVLNLSWNDIALKGDTRTRHLSECIVGLNIKDAKTGPLQFTSVRDTAVQDILHRYSLGTQSTGKAFPITYSRYLGKLKEAAHFFGLPGSLTPHSARIGGALHDYCNGMEAASIAIHGRWESLKSLRHYLSNGRAFIQAIQLTNEQQKIIYEYASATTDFLSTDTAFFSQAFAGRLQSRSAPEFRPNHANNPFQNSTSVSFYDYTVHSPGKARSRETHPHNQPFTVQNMERNSCSVSLTTSRNIGYSLRPKSVPRRRDWRMACRLRKDHRHSWKQREICSPPTVDTPCIALKRSRREWKLALRTRNL